MDFVKNIYDIARDSDGTTRCIWFSVAYKYALFVFAFGTVYFIISKQKNVGQVWGVLAIVMLVLTVIFYSKCHTPLPRRTVL